MDTRKEREERSISFINFIILFYSFFLLRSISIPIPIVHRQTDGHGRATAHVSLFALLAAWGSFLFLFLFILSLILFSLTLLLLETQTRPDLSDLDLK